MTTAMVVSAPMIRSLRECRSAHTPPKIDMTACGSMPKTMLIMSTAPDRVSMVRCHMTANMTSMDPSSEMVCPVRNSATFRFQPGMSWSAMLLPVMIPACLNGRLNAEAFSCPCDVGRRGAPELIGAEPPPPSGRL